MEANQIKTAEDAQSFLEGCVNDLENGIMTKAEFMQEMAEYTSKIGSMTRKGIIMNGLDKGHMRTIFEQSRATDMNFEEWYDFNYPI